MRYGIIASPWRNQGDLRGSPGKGDPLAFLDSKHHPGNASLFSQARHSHPNLQVCSHKPLHLWFECGI